MQSALRSTSTRIHSSALVSNPTLTANDTNSVAYIFAPFRVVSMLDFTVYLSRLSAFPGMLLTPSIYISRAVNHASESRMQLTEFGAWVPADFWAFDSMRRGTKPQTLPPLTTSRIPSYLRFRYTEAIGTIEAATIPR